jgi:hypothetical protein
VGWVLINAVHSMGRCNTILRTDLFKDGVYERCEAVETFYHRAERHLESMEGRAVLA